MKFLLNISMSFSSYEFFLVLAFAAIKATFLLSIVGLICLAFRGFSAATRHLLWAFVLCASLLLPFLSFVEVWKVPILPAPVIIDGNSAINQPSKNKEVVELFYTPELQELSVLNEKSDNVQEKSEPGNLVYLDETSNLSKQELLVQTNSASYLPQIFNWALVIWSGGVFLFLFRLFVGFISTSLLSSRADRFEDTQLNILFSALLFDLKLKKNVRLLSSINTLMPIVCGVFRPVVLLPSEAEKWSPERQRVVLLHELTHIARRDCLTQVLAQIACTFYWFNPLMWVAARRLKIEREQACDDYVLSIGTKPSDYAHHLLEIARSLNERPILKWSQTATVAMAGKSQLEGRLLAILSKERKRSAVHPVFTTSLLVLIGFLLVTLALIRPTVIDGRDTQISNGSITSNVNSAEKTFLERFLTSNSGDGRQAPFDDEKLRADIKKQIDNIDESEDDRTDALKDLEIEKNFETDAEREIGEKTSFQNPSKLQIPEVNPATSPEPNPYIDIQYQRLPKLQTQDNSEDFIDEMASVGYTNLTVDELINLKTAGITASYVKSLRSLGFNNLSVRELINMRSLGVSAAYIEGISNAGYKNLTVKELIGFKAVGVTPELISRYRNAGYDNLSAKQVSQFTVHGISADFINSMNSMGFGKLQPREIVSLRIFGVTPDFVRSARNRLGNDLTLKQIIELKNMGILKDK